MSNPKHQINRPNINDLLALQHVPRWSIVAHSKPQSVAEHTFGVLVIAMEIAHRMGMDLGIDAFIYAVLHDGPESYTADIPNGAKRIIEEESGPIDELFGGSPPMAELSPLEEVIIKIADRLEGIAFISKWGVGIHAQDVARLCVEELKRITVGYGDEALVTVVDDVYTDIVLERGRWRGQGQPRIESGKLTAP